MDGPNAATSEFWRLFVAIDLPDDVRQRAREMRCALEAEGWRARWVRSEALHLSLRFYGNQPVDSVPGLRERLRIASAGAHPFDLSTAGAGVFPNAGRPRVIWLGMQDRSGALTRLAEDIERESRAYGIEPESRPFRPHMTLARVRPEETGTIRAVARLFAEFESLPSLTFPVDHISLFRSELRREGPMYTVVERFDLGNLQ